MGCMSKHNKLGYYNTLVFGFNTFGQILKITQDQIRLLSLYSEGTFLGKITHPSLAEVWVSSGCAREERSRWGHISSSVNQIIFPMELFLWWISPFREQAGSVWPGESLVCNICGSVRDHWRDRVNAEHRASLWMVLASFRSLQLSNVQHCFHDKPSPSKPGEEAPQEGAS